ncbi:hypothetical protein HC256_005511 [Beauveria bassiana]|uniref:Uncharacterized protein n=1 Tax=Beauveria bassiana (strain ARSEF 2860) TaxID=655819 RepID=J4VTM2_BEAB2|nr:uncharacterized protein BBA_09142 [Beauveria bassiana ARSEF 2860]EJP61890.1 hypothetical protein BBA_09142 [Beauveria bassiana ARSEF 2860]KAH8712313.1 hypothetical protein HC256_005511 [Beauveria bassiana]
MVVLGFIANRWPGKIGSVAGAMMGVAAAILNDSWLVASTTNCAAGFQALPPARALLHDMVSLAICLGGLILIIFTGARSVNKDDDYEFQRLLDDEQFGEAYTLRRLMSAAHWFLVGVM